MEVALRRKYYPKLKTPTDLDDHRPDIYEPGGVYGGGAPAPAAHQLTISQVQPLQCAPSLLAHSTTNKEGVGRNAHCPSKLKTGDTSFSINGFGVRSPIDNFSLIVHSYYIFKIIRLVLKSKEGNNRSSNEKLSRGSGILL